MKFIFPFLFFSLILFTTRGATSQIDSIPQHLQNLELPDFKILLPDSATYFYKDNLAKKKYTLIMVFSPDCEHCKKQTEELISRIDQFKNTQILMTTTLPFDEMKRFYNEFKIAEYKNIIMGKDVLYFFSRYYKGKFVPYLALYNKKDELLNVYDGGVNINILIEQMK